MDQQKRNACSFHKSGASELLVGCLILLCLAPAAVWPAYHTTLSVGLNAVTRPFLRYWLGGVEPVTTIAKKNATSISSRLKLAEQARSMEFRIQQYGVQPERIRAWNTDWGYSTAQQTILLCLLLKQLPEATAQETPAIQKRDLLQTILDVAAEGRKSRPDNGFFWLAESLALFYSDQDTAAITALKKSQTCSHIDASLQELNRSEYAHWQITAHSRELLPPAPRLWGLGLDVPLHGFSRGLALQQNNLLRQYNIERAVEVTLLHLGLARQIAETAQTPADRAIAQAVAHRALEPFWTKHDSEPAPAQLEQNILDFLEDQGDKLATAKIRSWFSLIKTGAVIGSEKLALWRYLQLLAVWNVSSVLGSLFVQTTSLLLVWTTLAFFGARSFRGSPGEIRPSVVALRGITLIPFVIVPIWWTVSGWPAGGIYTLSGLAGAWLLWLGFMRFTCRKLSLEVLRAALTQGLVMMLMATWIVAMTAAYVFQYRQQ